VHRGGQALRRPCAQGQKNNANFATAGGALSSLPSSAPIFKFDELALRSENRCQAVDLLIPPQQRLPIPSLLAAYWPHLNIEVN